MRLHVHIIINTYINGHGKHLQYVAFYWLTEDWPTHCEMMLSHWALGMLETLVDGLLGIRDMVSHAKANTNERQNKKTSLNGI